jgi:hypothetical protein
LHKHKHNHHSHFSTAITTTTAQPLQRNHLQHTYDNNHHDANRNHHDGRSYVQVAAFATNMTLSKVVSLFQFGFH